MDPATLAIIFTSLAKEAPALVASVIAILHKQGHITPDEVAAYLVSVKTQTGASFFPTLPPQ